MILFLTATFFILGLIIGSFLNVVIYRINTKKSLGGRSACMSCQSKLSWYELIPVFSFFTLMGRCRSCKTKISIQYPLVELASGLIFATLFFKFSNQCGPAMGGEFISCLFTPMLVITYIYYAFMFSLLLVITTYDLKHKIIPDKLSLLFGVLAFLGLFFFNAHSYDSFYPHIPSILEFSSGVLIALPFALLWLISSGRWMGLGDAKLVLGLGWFLGLSRALSAVVLGFWSGAIVGILFIIFSKYKMKSELPFAPYLALGAFSAFIFGLSLFAPFRFLF